jgi:hypothetical protein
LANKIFTHNLLKRKSKKMKISVFLSAMVVASAAAAGLRRTATTNCTKATASTFVGIDNSERLLLREGVISALPKSLCDATRTGQKNVILVVVSIE